jgi:chromosomal replication initiation ATPase DnaA
VPIAAPDDELLRLLLRHILAERHVPVPEPVQEWMLRRLPRQAGAMREAAALLDNGQLQAQRSVTRRIAEQCLAPLLTGGDDPPIVLGLPQ